MTLFNCRTVFSVMKRALIMGAAGRDFHNFNVYFRNNPLYDVVAFTATQIPYIENRTYPPELAGWDRYPLGIPVFPESDLEEIIERYNVHEVFFSYSDVSYEHVMHIASKVAAAGASFMLLGPNYTQIPSKKMVVSVVATRTGAGKSTVSRMVVAAARKAGKHPVLIRHPMPYGDLVDSKIQHFKNSDDFKKYHITIEEEEEYAAHLELGTEILVGVDYAAILDKAEKIGDVIIWDGGNNDFSFYISNYTITVVDPLRAGDEFFYWPSEVNLQLADAVVINKVNSAHLLTVQKQESLISQSNSNAKIFKLTSQLKVDNPEIVRGKRVLVIEDGPSVTHGELSYGAGVQMARELGCIIIDPHMSAVGSIKDAYSKFPWIGPVIPALGYSEKQLNDLAESIQATPADAVILGTPADLRRRLTINKPVVRVSFEGRDFDQEELPFENYLSRIFTD